MVNTRAHWTNQQAMESARLDASTLEELRQEAIRYHLPVNASSSRELLIDALTAHFEQNSPLEEMLPPKQRSRTHSERSRKGSGQADLPGPSQVQAPSGEASGALDQIAATFGLFMEQQRQMINELRVFTQRETHVSAEITEESERESKPITDD
ncbi:unnamed protein product [Lasius platythorax]|uniref:Rho termination factor N-terminal domain-containing protein n=1 Tax=Lasius platythorax TaxID=488582 RepID=A0AAV2MYE0_9HYME